MFNASLVLAGLIFLSTFAAFGADLKITDSRGTEIVVIGASIDYSSFIISDKENEGIRVLQGDGAATVKWTDVEGEKKAFLRISVPLW